MKLNLTIVGFLLFSFTEMNAQNEIYLRQIGPSAANIAQVVSKGSTKVEYTFNNLTTIANKNSNQHSASGEIKMNAVQNTTSGGNEVLFHQVSQSSNSAILFQSGNNTSIIESEAVRANNLNIRQEGLSNYFKCTACSNVSNNMEVTQSGDNNTAIVVTCTLNDNYITIFQKRDFNSASLERNSMNILGNLKVIQH